MNDVYFELLLGNFMEIDGWPIIKPAALVPLKARAWLDLVQRRDGGEEVDSKDIRKHRNDIFRLAVTLPGQPGPRIDKAVRRDMLQFLDHFPEHAADWKGIRASLKGLPGGVVPSAEALRDALIVYFRLRGEDA